MVTAGIGRRRADFEQGDVAQFVGQVHIGWVLFWGALHGAGFGGEFAHENGGFVAKVACFAASDDVMVGEQPTRFVDDDAAAETALNTYDDRGGGGSLVDLGGGLGCAGRVFDVVQGVGGET